ncbi:unnamed protein product [Prunus armeniaca]
MGATTSKEAWETLKEEYQGNAKVHAVKLQTLRKDFENIKMKDSETSQGYYARVKEIINQLRAYGENINDSRIVEKILISLTDKYDPLVTAIEHTKDITSLSVAELMSSLEAYEKRLSRRNESPVESAFQSKLNLRSQKSKDDEKTREVENEPNNNWENKRETAERKDYPQCWVCKKTSHQEKDCWYRGIPKCWNCKRFGHIAKDCRCKKNYQANYTEENNKYEHVFYACLAPSGKDNTNWCINSSGNDQKTETATQLSAGAKNMASTISEYLAI